MKKIKATYHCGRTTKSGKVYNANHNTLNKTRDGQKHIDHDRTKENLLFRMENGRMVRCDSYNAIEYEKRRYKELFGESLEARNERYRQQRHKERCRDIESLYRDPKKCPFEMILQVGKANDGMSHEQRAELSKKINIEFIKEMHKRYGKNFIPLDLSGHYDETSIHWHYRGIFAYKGKDGLEPNQAKALAELGIERPDMTKPVGKRNNPLMTFTEQARELYYQICERHGLEIDREVRNPSQKHKETLEYKCEQLQIEADKEELRYKENKTKADKEEVRALSNSELAEKLVTQKVKHNKDGTVTIGLKQYQQATALVNETKKILESEVYSPAELKEMQIATKALQDEKSRYREVTENVMEQIDRKAVEMAQLQERSQQHQIEKLERELSKERYDKNYICEMIKKFLPEALLERFERFSGIVLQRREQEIQRIR